MLRLIHNRDAAGKHHSNIFGRLIGIGMDVALPIGSAFTHRILIENR
jgi:hypothetical protein